MYDYHSSLPDRYTSYMFYPNDRTLDPSFQNWVRLHKASHVPSTGPCRHPQSTLEPTGRCFRFLLAFVKQTLFALNFATCPAVSSFPVISSPATPRHATVLYICLALEPADGPQEVSQKDSLRLRTVQEKEGQGKSVVSYPHIPLRGQRSVSNCHPQRHPLTITLHVV